MLLLAVCSSIATMTAGIARSQYSWVWCAEIALVFVLWLAYWIAQHRLGDLEGAATVFDVANKRVRTTFVLPVWWKLIFSIAFTALVAVALIFWARWTYSYEEDWIFGLFLYSTGFYLIYLCANWFSIFALLLNHGVMIRMDRKSFKHIALPDIPWAHVIRVGTVERESGDAKYKFFCLEINSDFFEKIYPPAWIRWANMSFVKYDANLREIQVQFSFLSKSDSSLDRSAAFWKKKTKT